MAKIHPDSGGSLPLLSYRAGKATQAYQRKKMRMLFIFYGMEDGVGNGSIILINKALSAMFNHGVSEDYFRRNYAHGCTKELGIYNIKRDAVTQTQQAEFLKFIRESKEYSSYFWMFEFFLETGCRSGEETGFLWGNIDFRKKLIKIDHQLLYELDEEGKRRFQICLPKTIKGINLLYPFYLLSFADICKDNLIFYTLQNCNNSERNVSQFNGIHFFFSLQ